MKATNPGSVRLTRLTKHNTKLQCSHFKSNISHVSSPALYSVTFHCNSGVTWEHKPLKHTFLFTDNNYLITVCTKQELKFFYLMTANKRDICDLWWLLMNFTVLIFPPLFHAENNWVGLSLDRLVETVKRGGRGEKHPKQEEQEKTKAEKHCMKRGQDEGGKT